MISFVHATTIVFRNTVIKAETQFVYVFSLPCSPTNNDGWTGLELITLVKLHMSLI